MSDSTKADGARSQTLSRGIQVLEVLAASGPLSIDELALRMGLHRSVTYRLLRTLEDHRLVVRDAAGRAVLGARLAALAAEVAHDLQAAALPELTTAANELGMTAFIAVLDRDEAVTLVSVEPRGTIATVAQRPGTRHPVGIGAPGKAILSILPASARPADLDPARADEAAEAVATSGFATSHDEVITGLRSVAVPLRLRGYSPAAIAVVYVASALDPEQIAARLEAAAHAVQTTLGA